MDGDSSLSCDKDDQEDSSFPLVPPRKKHPAKQKEDGVEVTCKKVRPVAIVKDTVPPNVMEKNTREQSAVTKGSRPPRPPPPVRNSEENILDSTEEKRSGVTSSPKLKLKPMIPTRPCVTKENITSNVQVEEKRVENTTKENERLSQNENQLNNEIIPRKPKPTPRPRPRKTVDTKPPTPQPRKLVTPTFKQEKSIEETESCLEMKPADKCVLYKTNESIDNNMIQTDITKLKNNTINNTVNNDIKFAGVTEDEIDSQPNGSEKDNENFVIIQGSIVDSEDTSATHKDDLAGDRTNIIPMRNEGIFYSEENQECFDNSTDHTTDIKDIDSTQDTYRTLSDTLHGNSFKDRKSQNWSRKMKRSFSETNLLESQQKLLNNETLLIKSLTDDTKGNRYENIKLQSELDNEKVVDDSPSCNNISTNTQQNIKQSLLGNEHSYQNVAMYDTQTSSFSESLNILQKLHKHPVFFLPKIYPKSNSNEKKHSNSCDTVFVNQTLSNIEETIYQTPLPSSEIYTVPPSNRDSDGGIYTIPPNNKTVDFYNENSQHRNSLSSSFPSDRSSAASRESARFSVTSNSSHNSSVGEKSLPYENVDLPNNEEHNVSNGDKGCLNQWKLEVTKTDGGDDSSNNKKQQRTCSKRESDDTSYMNIPPAGTQTKGSYIEIDFTNHKEKNRGKTKTKTPKSAKLPSNCFLPTELLEENASSIYSTKKIEEKRLSGRMSTVFDEATGEYHNYFESSEEDESDEKVQEKSKLFLIASEILATEKSFVEGLQLICKDFGGALKIAMGRNTKLLPDGAYSAMFMNIEQIYALDKKFLQELQERMQHWELHQRIGDLVREYGHFLKMYTVYIKGYDSAIHMFHECLSNNMKFLQIVEEFEKSSKAKNMKLSSFLLKPIQRIPSYRLLLIDYLGNLPEDHLDYKDISDGLDIVSEVASHINESMKEGEKFQEVLRIQSQITNCKDIVKPGRYLIKEGSLQKLSRKELQQRTFILFTDALLYCSYTGSQLKLINELPLVGMTVQIPDSQDLENEFVVISTKRSFLLNAKSPEEREEWVVALQAAAQIANEKVGTFITKKDRSSTLLSADLGHIAPPWIPDSRVTMCQICTDAFTVYNRRHHCRACGKVVCNDCSAYEAPLEYMDHEAARVCSICYNQLFEQHTLESSPANRLLSRFKDTKGKKRKNRLKLPSSLTEVAAQEEGIQSGFLRMRKEGKKEKRRWFVLKDYVLYMYKASSDPAATSTTPVLGYEVRVAGNWDEDDFLFTLSHPGVKDTIVLRAEDRMAAEKWVHCLLKATELHVNEV